MPHRPGLPPELGPFAEELRRAFAELDSRRELADLAWHGEYRPAVDVVETPGAVEVTIDLPGVTATDIRVIVRGGLIMVVGDKYPPRPAPPGATFHVAERGFGRFARMVRLSSAYDARHATAELRHGALRIVVPKLEERRGGPVLVPIRQAD
ncbi:MAG: Hsp20/alpha crystallin family protein [Acidobacteriota bacterium]|nr:Hsp20/alpha crystallin family protein [Acidobacteriota bacterium]